MEAMAILKILKEFPQQKAWLSFSCKVIYINNYVKKDICYLHINRYLNKTVK